MARNRFIGAHATDIDDVGTSMAREINSNNKTCPLIHKIQQHIHDKDKKAYEPSNFSIGPYHYWTPELRVMEKSKWAYFSYVLELNHEKKLQDYIEAMYKLERKARSCYPNEINMDRKRFVEMLLLDGCFILLAFNGIAGIVPDFNKSTEKTNINIDQNKDQTVIDVESIQNEGLHENGQENSFEIEQFYTNYIVPDALLLENQIPFFVITKIYKLVTGGQSKSFLMKNILESMEHVLDCYPNTIGESDRPKHFYHLLHLCHMYFKFKPGKREVENCDNHVRPLPFHNFLHLRDNFTKQIMQKLSSDHTYQSPREKQTCIRWRQATQYHEARIELKKRELCTGNPHFLLDIKFNNGTLEIPFFNIDQKNCDLFQNLVAFEQTYPQYGNYITAYVVFWSQFISNPDDIVFLVDKGIMHHLHNYKEVSDFFRSLGDAIDFDLSSDYYLKYTCGMMEEHY